MKFRGLGKTYSVVCLFLLGACGGGGDSGGGGGGGPTTPTTTATYVVDFSPQQVVGATATPDTVTATASLSTASGDEITASGSVTVNGANATSVTINVGYAGENGPVALALTDAGGGRWNVPSNTLLDIEELRRLEVTGFYVAIQTPAGELRGQIRLPDWVVGVIDLDADSVIPSSSSTGSGKGGFGLNPRTGQFRARITVEGVAAVTSAGIRNAIAGASGDVVIALEQSMTDAGVWGTIDINNPDAGNILTQVGLDLLLKASLYFSVESTATVDGDLRGQLIDESVIEVFDTVLTSFEVVTSGPPVNSNAEGTATVTWSESMSLFAVAVNTDITNALSVTVHQGTAGEIGTALFSLMPDTMLPGNWVLPITALDATQAASFVNDEFYINVVTAAHAEGELRGQLDSDASLGASSMTIGENGGVLSVRTKSGDTVMLTVSQDALFDESVDMSISVTESPTFLPDALEPIVTVQLDPAGTTFADFAEMEIRGALGEGAKLAFIANDDGTIIDYRPLLGDDAIAASQATNLARFEVPHFSKAGVVKIDPDNCGTDVPVGGATAEQVAINELTAHNAYISCLQMLGVNAIPDSDLIASLLQAWFNDLEKRSAQTGAKNLKVFGELSFELLRYAETSQMNGQEFVLGSDRVSSNLGDLFRAKVIEFDNACRGGQTERTDNFIRWSGKAYRAFAGRPSSWSKATISCLVTAEVSPAEPQVAVVDAPQVTFEPSVTGADGRDLSFFSVLGLWWDTTMGQNQADGYYLVMDTSFVGLRKSKLMATYVNFAEAPAANGIVVWDHTGSRQLAVEGSATECTDPDDNGSRQFRFPVTIVSQSAVANSPGSATVTFSGSGSAGDISIDNVTISATYNDNTESNLAGTATGSLSFTESGVDPDTGEPFTNSGSLNLGTASVSSDVFKFPMATGSDSEGCRLRGLVELEIVR